MNQTNDQWNQTSVGQENLFVSMHSILPDKPPRMGLTRYFEREDDISQWTQRTNNIAQDTRKPFEKKMKGIRDKVDELE